MMTSGELRYSFFAPFVIYNSSSVVNPGNLQSLGTPVKVNPEKPYSGTQLINVIFYFQYAVLVMIITLAEVVIVALLFSGTVSKSIKSNSLVKVKSANLELWGSKLLCL